MKKIPYYIIMILLFIIGIQYCSRPVEPIKQDRPEIHLIEKEIINYKDSIIFRDSVIFTYVTLKDSISKKNKVTLEKHYSEQMDTLSENRSEKLDTLIASLVFEIDISDTIIEQLNETIEYRDTVIHQLEIMNKTNRLYIEDVERELVKAEKKNKRKNIWLIITTTIAAVLAVILVAS